MEDDQRIYANPPQVLSNRIFSVCSDPADPAHDDLALDAEWSDEERGCTGDGPHPQEQGKRVREEIDMFKMIFKMFQMFNKFYWSIGDWKF